MLQWCGEIGDEDRSLMQRAGERAERFEDYSEKRGQEADEEKQGHDLDRGLALLRHLQGKGREDCGSGGTGRGDQPIGAAQKRSQDAQHDDPDDASEGALGSKLRAERGIDRDAEGYRGGESDQHRGETAPQVAVMKCIGLELTEHKSPRLPISD